jgi:hypothetical protein
MVIKVLESYGKLIDAELKRVVSAGNRNIIFLQAEKE